MKIARGITRTVFLTRRWAIKVPSLRTHERGLSGLLWSLCRGILANLSEAEWSGFSDRLCPVLKSFAGVVNIYPRCEPLDYDPSEKTYNMLSFGSPMDRKRQNVGRMSNGKLVWLDYDMNYNDPPPCRHVKVDKYEIS